MSRSLLSMRVTLRLVCATLSLAISEAGWCKDSITLQLKWTHCFQFAGYYAAQSLGYYRDAGLDVTIEEGHPGVDVVDRVVSGKAQYGISNSTLLLDRASGLPVQALAVILQHSPLVLIQQGASGADSIHDIIGKRVMIEPDAAEMYAYFKRMGIDPKKINIVDHSFDIQELVRGDVDALTAYVSNEPDLLDSLGFSYRIYTPRSAGIDFYADNLFTTDAEISQHPERVKAFIAASVKGWHYAVTHVDEVIDIIINQYAGKDTRGHYQFEAKQLIQLMHPELIEIGYMNPGRWQHIAEVYIELGLLSDTLALKGFLYEPEQGIALGKLKKISAGVIAFILMLSGLSAYVYWINRRLRQTLANLRATQEQLSLFRLAVQQSPTSIMITDQRACMEYVNPRLCEETGYSEQELLGQNPRLFKSGLTPAATFVNMWQTLSRGDPWAGELVNRGKDGNVFWEEAHIAPLKYGNKSITHYVAVKLNVTERKHALDRLAFMAHHDALTNLPNRSLFFERLNQAISQSARSGKKIALLFLDLDHFKPINDNLGHAAGDFVLLEVAKRITEVVRASDTVGRVGGDEFVILLLDVPGNEAALEVAEKIRGALAQPFIIEEEPFLLSSSIGVAIYPDHGRDATTLARHADEAMYGAKQGGRNGVKLFYAEI